MENKGTSIAIWIIAIVLVIFLFGGIIFLAGLAEVTAPPEVTVTTGEVTDHDLTTSIKVTLEGEQDYYKLLMTGPEGTEVDSVRITEAQMADGKQSVWVELIEGYADEVEAKSGAYSLIVTDLWDHLVYEESFGPYSGSNLSVVNIGTITTEYGGYGIESIPLTVKNNGDLPAYVSGVIVTIDNTEDSSTIPEVDEVILPGETTTITASELSFVSFGEGEYSAIFELREGSYGEGKTVATYTTTISIP